MQILANLSHEETTYIYDLIEKKFALENLEICLTEVEDKQDLYCKCRIEKEEIEQKYAQWWEGIIEKYQLQEYPYEKLIVDAIGETIQME